MSVPESVSCFGLLQIHFCRLPVSRSYAIISSMTLRHDQIDRLKDQILPVLLPYGVERVSLFGSIARGEDQPDSDVDILVHLKPRTSRPPLGFVTWIGIERELSLRLHRPVDLVTEDGISPFIRPYIEQDRIVLYEEA